MSSQTAQSVIKQEYLAQTWNMESKTQHSLNHFDGHASMAIKIVQNCLDLHGKKVKGKWYTDLLWVKTQLKTKFSDLFIHPNQ